MKKLIVLIAATALIKSTFADIDRTQVSITPEFEVVEASKITQLKDSMEKDSNLVFTISYFYYVGLNSYDFNTIIEELGNGVWPTAENRVLTFSQTHYAYDEEFSHSYSGKRYIAIDQTGDEIRFMVFWINPVDRTKK